MQPLTRTGQAIALMLISMACFSCMTSVIRLLAAEIHPMQIVLLRNLFSLAIVIIVAMCVERGLPRFKTRRIGGHFWRASIGSLSMQIWFYALTIMPLTLATALSFITPVLTTLIAIVFLGEKAGIRRWSAIIIGFIGVLIMLRPDASGSHSGIFLVLGSAALMAVAGTVVKALTRTESPETIVFFMSLIMLLWSLVPGIYTWQTPTPYQLWLSFLIALFSTGAHLMLARAYTRADMVVLMPFDFSRLIFTGILAYLLFDETMDAQTITGALIIVASTVYIAHRETWKKRRDPQEI
jgi:drug/metabolite transporter (DMT)-like permease